MLFLLLAKRQYDKSYLQGVEKMKMLKTIQWLCAASTVVFFSPSSIAESYALQKSTTLSDAVKTAVDWHPRIKQSQAQLLRQQYSIDIAEAGYYPQISGGLQGGYEGNGGENDFSQSVVLSASQMLYDFGKIDQEVASQRAVSQQYAAELLMVVDEISEKVASSVIQVWRYQSLEKTAKDQVASLEKIMDLVEVRYQKGAATKSDWAQSQARVQSSKALTLQYTTQKQIWQSRLASLLGERSGVVVSENPSSINTATCDYTIESLNTVPRLAIALAKQRQAIAISKQSDAKLKPTISLDPSVTHYIQRPKWDTTAGDENTDYAIYLNVNMPLYQGGAMQAEKSAALASEQSADAAVSDARLSIIEILLEASAQKETLLHHRRVLEAREEYSRQTRDLYQQQYLELGSRPLLDLLNAEQDIYQAQMDQINIENDMSSLGLSCANAKGELRELFGLVVNE